MCLIMFNLYLSTVYLKGCHYGLFYAIAICLIDCPSCLNEIYLYINFLYVNNIIIFSIFYQKKENVKW